MNILIINPKCNILRILFKFIYVDILIHAIAFYHEEHVGTPVNVFCLSKEKIYFFNGIKMEQIITLSDCQCHR